MVIGTAVDEQRTSLAGFRKLIENQQKQSEGLDLHFSRLDVYRDFSADENVAIVVEEITIKITVNSESVQFTVRSSAVLEFKNQQWKLIHWHASKPENVQNESDTFGIEEWKQKAEELEKLVAERTADLIKKNRELKIESSLEQVRSKRGHAPIARAGRSGFGSFSTNQGFRLCDVVMWVLVALETG